MNDWLFFWLRISLQRINPYSNFMPYVLEDLFCRMRTASGLRNPRPTFEYTTLGLCHYDFDIPLPSAFLHTHPQTPFLPLVSL